MSGDYTELKASALAMKGWDNMSSCWPAEGEPADWQVGRLDEDDNQYPILTVDTAEYGQPEAAPVVARYYAAAHPEAVLGLIQEVEQLRQIPPCDPDVYQRGSSVAVIGDMPRDAAEQLCRGLSVLTGWRIDWHYLGGRVHVKALPPAGASAATDQVQQ
ncbi:hypothetical protein [Pseudomonas sp. B26(2017)]|uniref:hypothetical protein n=1 Tax=Pseudomonas sp. B26(2017) TaxID=1981732 RepID=UPI000A1E862A|nr:hypothetical protein [Pseudomonas sp. B26(2017)]